MSAAAMSTAQVLGLFAAAVAYLAALLGPVWFMGDTLLWIADDRRVRGSTQ